MRRSVWFWTVVWMIVYALQPSRAAVPAAPAADWQVLIKELAKSVVPIERDDNGTSCTGFVVNSNVRKKDEHRNYVFTAAHCEAAKMWADQAVATVAYKNGDKDLLILETDNLDRPALKLAKDDPDVADEVGSFGYGYGLEKPLFRISHISSKTYIPYEGIGGPIFFTDATFVPGQSGGPVINGAGEVVMVVQLGTPAVGIGVGADVLRDKIGKYWEKPSKP